jgi:hypothetical protein
MATPSNISSSLVVDQAISGNSDQVIVEDPSVKAVSGDSRPADTTMFVDDANVVERDLSHAAHIDNTFLDLQDTDTMTQDIISFLAKPIVLASGTFSTTDTYSFLNNYSMPYAAFTASQGLVWTQKLAGIFGIRMDMRFRIVVNANRFQQGRYCIGWVPLAAPLTSVSTFKEIAFNNSHMATLVQRTTIPHVEFDLCDDTTAELVVPYVSSRNFYEMNSVLSTTNNYALGYLNVYPYSPMVSPAGSTTAGYTLYVSLENVKLFGAASAQSGLRGKKIRDHEVSNKANGPISSISSAISKGFKEFEKVPLISSFAGQVSWIADRVTGVASIFGWSKPTQGDSLMKVVLYQGGNHNCIDGDSDARPVSFLSKPGVTKLNGVSGTEFDEMDFSYIVRKPAWFATYTWSNASPSGTVLATILNTPDQRYIVGGATHFQPVAFVNALFMHWRGSLRYRLKFVRTEFHSGRIQIAFYPGTSSITYVGNAAYVHRMIVDIRETPEIDFVVPYISAGAYTVGNTGAIVISVADALVAPAVVSASVTILAEICGGEDMEFAIPQNFNYTPRVFTPQSGLNVDKLTVMNIGSTTVTANPNLNSAVAVGDKVSSFRAYLKRYHPITSNNYGITSTVLQNGSSYNINVDGIPGIGNGAPPTDYFRADLTATVASCYAIWRGGVRIRAVVNKNMFISTATQLNTPSMSRVYTYPANSTGQASGSSMFFGSGGVEVNMNSHQQFQDLRNNAIISAEVPQYNGLVARSVVDCMFYQGAGVNYQMSSGTDGSMTNVQLGIALPLSQTSGITAIAGQQLWSFFRSLADDGEFGCFISVPAMTATAAVSAVNPSLY